jgi:cellulose synthase/poly-beta-1,6-N-acetylglucosamine synthase-like glycosyltransferase
VAIVALAAGLVLSPRITVTLAVAAVTLLFVFTTMVRLVYLYRGYRIVRSRLSPPAILPREPPRYTVLVPLYHEANVVAPLCDALAALSYPSERLEVLLLVEHDDPETYAACAAHLRPSWRIIVVPEGVPRTKPRALNVGLAHASGELVTIFDAEDRPEADQLAKAAEAFDRLPPKVAALQARLDFYNQGQNPLTKWFTCEYLTHFGLYLEGIAGYRHPMPLGGTSTHFRTDAIRAIGGWNAWNVTEDCELGMRLAAEGFDSLVLDSVTWEEAVPRPRAWVLQRSRWVKGFAQTGLVLLRRPIKTARAMGPVRYGSSLAVVASVPATLCAQIVFWATLCAYILLHTFVGSVHAIKAVFPEPFLTLGLASLLFGNFAILLAFVSAVYERGRFELVRWSVVVPVYWLFMSVAAWKGVLQLFRRPHFWEKTTHGMAAEPAAATSERPSLVPLPTTQEGDANGVPPYAPSANGRGDADRAPTAPEDRVEDLSG